MTGWAETTPDRTSRRCEDPGAGRSMRSSRNERALEKFLVTGPTPRLIVIMNFAHPADTSAGETGIRCKEMVSVRAEAA